jgi:RHS repeat-associated protein
MSIRFGASWFSQFKRGLALTGLGLLLGSSSAFATADDTGTESGSSSASDSNLTSESSSESSSSEKPPTLIRIPHVTGFVGTWGPKRDENGHGMWVEHDRSGTPVHGATRWPDAEITMLTGASVRSLYIYWQEEKRRFSEEYGVAPIVLSRADFTTSARCIELDGSDGTPAPLDAAIHWVVVSPAAIDEDSPLPIPYCDQLVLVQSALAWSTVAEIALGEQPTDSDDASSTSTGSSTDDSSTSESSSSSGEPVDRSVTGALVDPDGNVLAIARGDHYFALESTFAEFLDFEPGAAQNKVDRLCRAVMTPAEEAEFEAMTPAQQADWQVRRTPDRLFENCPPGYFKHIAMPIQGARLYTLGSTVTQIDPRSYFGEDALTDMSRNIDAQKQLPPFVDLTRMWVESDFVGHYALPVSFPGAYMALNQARSWSAMISRHPVIDLLNSPIAGTMASGFMGIFSTYAQIEKFHVVAELRYDSFNPRNPGAGFFRERSSAKPIFGIGSINSSFYNVAVDTASLLIRAKVWRGPRVAPEFGIRPKNDDTEDNNSTATTTTSATTTSSSSTSSEPPPRFQEASGWQGVPYGEFSRYEVNKLDRDQPLFNEGLLAQIGRADLTRTDVYIYNAATGALVGTRQGVLGHGTQSFDEPDDEAAPREPAELLFTTIVRGPNDISDDLEYGRGLGPGLFNWGWVKKSDADSTGTASNSDETSTNSSSEPAGDRYGIGIVADSTVIREAIANEITGLRMHDAVDVVVVNRATGYMGTAKGMVVPGSNRMPVIVPRMPAKDENESDSQDFDQVNNRVAYGMNPELDIELRPPNLKIRIERTRADNKVNLITGDGAGLTSDTSIRIFTEWFDENGGPLPEGLPGFTGRISRVVDGKLVSPDAMSDNDDSVGEFSIEPGRHMVVIQLPQKNIDRQHYYVHVSGVPQNESLNFVSGMLGDDSKIKDKWSTDKVFYEGFFDDAQGKLQSSWVEIEKPEEDRVGLSGRPATFVPFQVLRFDRNLTRITAAAQMKALQEAWLAGDRTMPVLREVNAVYRWLYSPEMHFSLFDLDIESIDVQTGDQTKTNPDGTKVLVTHTLTDPGSDLPGLGSSDGSEVDDGLIWGVGLDQITEVNNDGQIQGNDLDQQLGSFPGIDAVGGNLGDLTAEDFLTLSLFVEGDEANALWEIDNLLLLLSIPRRLDFVRLRASAEEGGGQPRILKDSSETLRFVLTHWAKVRVGIRDFRGDDDSIRWIWDHETLQEPNEYFAFVSTKDVIDAGIDPESHEVFEVIVRASRWDPEAGEAYEPPHTHTIAYPSFLSYEWEHKDAGPKLGNGNLANGALSLFASDISIPSVGPSLEVNRSYSNREGRTSTSVLGIGWSHNFDIGAYGIELERDDAPEQDVEATTPKWLEDLHQRILTREDLSNALPKSWRVISVRGVRFERKNGAWWPANGNAGLLREVDAEDGTENKNLVFTDETGTQYFFEMPVVPVPPTPMQAGPDGEGKNEADPDNPFIRVRDGLAYRIGLPPFRIQDIQGESPGEDTDESSSEPEVTSAPEDETSTASSSTATTVSETLEGAATSSSMSGSESATETSSADPNELPDKPKFKEVETDEPPPAGEGETVGVPMAGRLMKVVAPNGQALTFAYHDSKQRELKSVSDGFGRQLNYTYRTCRQRGDCYSRSQAASRLASVNLVADGATVESLSFAYDLNGYLKQVSGAEGVVDYAYAPEKTDPESLSTPFNLVAESTPGPDGHTLVTEYAYFPEEPGAAFECRGDGETEPLPLLLEVNGAPITPYEVLARTKQNNETADEDAVASDGVESVTCYGFEEGEGGNVVRIVSNARKQTTKYTLNGNGNVIKIEEPKGRVLTFKWRIDDEDAESSAYTNHITHMCEWFGTSGSDEGERCMRSYDYEYAFDVYGRAERRTTIGPTTGTSANITEETTFDPRFGLPLMTRDRNGIVQTWLYGENGTLQEHVDARGKTWTYTYHAGAPHSGLLQSVSVEGQLHAEFTYDDHGYMATSTKKVTCVAGQSVCTPRDETTVYENDAIGLLRYESSPEGVARWYEYDAGRSLNKTTYPTLICPPGTPPELAGSCTASGKASTAQYDSQGRKLNETDLVGLRLDYHYNSRGLLRQIVRNSDNATRNFFYDNGGNLVGATDWTGALERYEYDELGRRVRVWGRTNAATEFEEFRYDLADNVVYHRTLGGIETYYRYDDEDRLVETCSGTPCSDFDDDAGSFHELVSYIREPGEDPGDVAWGRSVTIRRGGDDPDATMTTFLTATGEPARVIDPDGREQTWTYTNYGAVQEWKDRDGIVTRYESDSEGRIWRSERNGMLNASVTGSLIHEIEYDLDGRISALAGPHLKQDGTALRTEFDYDDWGRRTRVLQNTNDEGAFEYTTVYDLAGLEIWSSNPGGAKTKTERDLLGRPVVITDPIGRQATQRFDANGNRIEFVDETGLRSCWYYVTGDRLVEQSIGVASDCESNSLLPEGVRIRYPIEQMDADGFPKQIIDPLGRIHERHRDRNGRIDREQILGMGGATVRTFTNDGLIKTVTDPNESRWSYTYDALGRVIGIKHPDESTESINYSTPRQITTTGRNGVTRRALINDFEEVYLMEEGGQTIAERDLDAAGRVLATRDAASAQTDFSYTERGLLKKILEPVVDGESAGSRPATSFQYTRGGLIEIATDASGQKTKLEYDDAGRITRSIAFFETDAAETTTYAYPSNNLVRVTAPNAQPGGSFDGHVSEYVRDALGRLIAVKEPRAGGTLATRFGYNHLGQPTTVEEGDILTHKTEYDELGRVVRGIRYTGEVGQPAVSRVTTFEDHDKNGVPRRVIDPRGVITSLNYDAFGRLKLATYTKPSDHPESQPWPIQRKWVYEGDELREASVTKHWPLGVSTDDKLTYQYDGPRRQLKSITEHHEWWNGSSTKTTELATSVAFDSRGLLKCVGAGNSNVCESSATGPDITRYTYDDRGQVKTIEVEFDTTTFEYYSDGRQKLVTLANNAKTEYSYHDLHDGDGSSRLKGIRHKRDALTVANFEYYYHKGGLISQELRHEEGDTRTWLMDYDSIGRLTQIVESDGGVARTSAYTFGDGYDRRTEVVAENGVTVRNATFDYDRSHQLLRIADSSSGKITEYAHDPSGNLTLRKQTAPSFAAAKFGYNALDQLVEVRSVDAGGVPGTVLGMYDYDIEGQRIREWHAQLDLNGAPIAAPPIGLERFYFGGRVQQERHLDAPAGSIPDRYHWVGDTLLAANIDGERGYAHGDARGSIAAITNSSGDVVGNWRVDPWGRAEASASNEGGLGAQRHVFGGHVSDRATGLVYMRARYYDPEAGLFLTKDPASGSAEDPRSRHPYLYAHASPLSGIDPSGRSTVFLGQHGTGVFSDGGVTNPSAYNPIPTHWTEDIAAMRKGLQDALTSVYVGAIEAEAMAMEIDMGERQIAAMNKIADAAEQTSLKGLANISAKDGGNSWVIEAAYFASSAQEGAVLWVKDKLVDAGAKFHDGFNSYSSTSTGERNAWVDFGLDLSAEMIAAPLDVTSFMAVGGAFSRIGSAVKFVGKAIKIAAKKSAKAMINVARDSGRMLRNGARGAASRARKALVGHAKSVGNAARRHLNDPFERARKNLGKHSGAPTRPHPKPTGRPQGSALKDAAKDPGVKPPHPPHGAPNKPDAPDKMPDGPDGSPDGNNGAGRIFCELGLEPAGCFAAGTLVLLAATTTPIEQVDLGQRVITDAMQIAGSLDEQAQAACPSEVNEAWKRLTLVVDGQLDGEDFIAETLKSPQWMAENHAQVGGTVWMEVRELGIASFARVLAIEEAPEIEAGPGCVVLSRFTRENHNLIELHLGSGEKLELTDTHLLYSATRDQWVSAGSLWEGEYLQGAFATVPVLAMEWVEGGRQVFNLEVERDHRYVVGDARVLAHNAKPGGPRCTGLTRAQSRNITKIDDIIGHGAKPGDFTGVAAELRGVRFPKPGGGFWDHISEMQNNLVGLKKSIGGLQGSLKNPNLGPAERQAISAAIQRGEATALQMTETLAGLR